MFTLFIFAARPPPHSMCVCVLSAERQTLKIQANACGYARECVYLRENESELPLGFSPLFVPSVRPFRCLRSTCICMQVPVCHCRHDCTLKKIRTILETLRIWCTPIHRTGLHVLVCTRCTLNPNACTFFRV